jgi:radical SAM protein with 4Fe4S-binding SPASM domain
MKDYLPKACSGCGQMAACDGGCREAAHICGGGLESLDPALTEADVRRFASRG